MDPTPGTPADQADLLEAFEATDSALCIYSLPEPGDGYPWNLRFEFANQAFRRTFWESKGDQLGRYLTEVCRDVGPEALDALREVWESGQATRGEAFIAEVGGWFDCRLWKTATGRLVSLMTDVTAREQQRKAADQELARFKAFFDLGAPQLVVQASSGRILQANPGAAEFYGWAQADLEALTIDQIRAQGPDQSRRDLDRALAQGHGVWRGRHRLRSGEVRNVEVHSRAGVWDEERVLYSVIFDRGRADDDLLAALRRSGALRRLERRDCLWTEGRVPETAALVEEGYLRCYRIDRRGEEVTLGFLRPGQLLAPGSTDEEALPSRFTVEALTPVTVFVVERPRFLHLLEADPRRFRDLYRLLATAFRQKEAREAALLSDDLKSQYQAFLEEYQDLAPHLRNYQIASYLGVSPETLSRLRSSPVGRKLREVNVLREGGR